MAAASLASGVPWLLFYLLLLSNRLGNDVDPSPEGARLGALFLASIFGAGAFASFGTSPRSRLGRNCLAVAGVATLVVTVVRLAEGPRFKSDPPFGEKPLDVIILTVPALVTGLLLVAWRTLRPSRDGTTAVLALVACLLGVTAGRADDLITGVTTTQANWRQLQFGIDAGSEPPSTVAATVA